MLHRIFLACIALSLSTYVYAFLDTYPEAYGTYVWNGTKWRQLGASKDKVVTDVTTETMVLLFDKMVVNGKKVQVNRSIFIDREIKMDPSGNNRTESKVLGWVPNIGGEVEGDLYPVKGNNEMIIWKPKHPMSPGVYGLTGSSNTEQFSVALKSLKIGESEVCKIKISFEAFGGIPMGIPPEYLPCKPKELPFKERSCFYGAVQDAFGDKYSLNGNIALVLDKAGNPAKCKVGVPLPQPKNCPPLNYSNPRQFNACGD